MDTNFYIHFLSMENVKQIRKNSLFVKVYSREKFQKRSFTKVCSREKFRKKSFVKVIISYYTSLKYLAFHE